MRLKIFCLLLISGIFCQRVSAQIQYGVKGGGNLSAILLDIGDGDGYLQTKLIPGFHIGGFVELPLSEKFALQPSLLFSTKGYKVDEKGFSSYLFGVDNITFTSHYLELPINFIFKPQVGAGNLLLGAGPYIGYGLGGNWKTDVSRMNVKGKLMFVNDYKITDSAALESTDVPYAQKFDFGGNILIGFEFNSNFYFHINGQIGLIDIQPRLNGVKDKESSMKTVGGGLSFGYKF